MTVNKWYIAGPMTGMPGLNFENFNRVATELRNQYFEVANPAEINPDLDADWTECMRADIKQLVDCDAIYMLDGWETSRGASIEYIIAKALGMQIFLE